MALQEGLVSIITPVYNSAKTISATIESVQAQTYANWEMLIVIDRGTKDNTEDIVERHRILEPRIRFLKIANAKGISLARNLALREARGQYIAFLDSDDLWLPTKLEKQLSLMRSNDIYFSCTAYRRINEDNSRTGHLRLPPKKQTYRGLLKNNLISCPTVIYDQSKLGLFQMHEHPHEDYILWLDIVKKAGVCIGIQEDLARYRIASNSRSMNVNRPLSRWKVYRQFEKLNFFMAAYYLANYAVTALFKRTQH